MFAIFGITLPIYLIIGVGFLAVRLGLFQKSDLPALGKYLINAALPALLFIAMAERKISEILNYHYIIVYLFGTLGLMAIAWLWGKYISKSDQLERVFQIMGMSCPNSGFVGYPMLLMVLPAIAGVALALNMLVENVFLIALLLALAERAQDRANGLEPTWRSSIILTLQRIAKNPMIIGLLLGAFVSFLGWPLPEPLAKSVKFIAQSSTAIALFVIGGTLVGLPFKGLGRKVFPIVWGKLVWQPLAIFVFLMLYCAVVGSNVLSPDMKNALILTGAMPSMSIYPVFAQRYGQQDVAAAALVAGTVASFFTLNILLWFMQHQMMPW